MNILSELCALTLTENIFPYNTTGINPTLIQNIIVNI